MSPGVEHIFGLYDGQHRFLSPHWSLDGAQQHAEVHAQKRLEWWNDSPGWWDSLEGRYSIVRMDMQP